MMIMMPFMFVSGAFAPLATMPAWMRTMAAFNPVAHATDALRGHVLGTATVGDTAIALAIRDRARTARQPPIDKGLARREMINVPRPTARSKSLRRQAKACNSSCGGSLQLDEAQSVVVPQALQENGHYPPPVLVSARRRSEHRCADRCSTRGASVNIRCVVLTWNGLSSGRVILFRGTLG